MHRKYSSNDQLYYQFYNVVSGVRGIGLSMYTVFINYSHAG